MLYTATMAAETAGGKLTKFPYLLATRVLAPEAPLPAGKRVPFGWQAWCLPEAGADRKVAVRFPVSREKASEGRLRLTVAVDIREEKLVEVALPKTGRVLGTLDIRYAYALQPFELLLDAAAMAAIAREGGVVLRMAQGEQPAWFFGPEKETGAPPAQACPPGLLPHLLPVMDRVPMEAFRQNLASLHSVQQFGWMEGCVLDGLYDLAQTGDTNAKEALHRHLDLFFDEGQQLVYENPRSEPVDGKIYGIEGTLPFAVLAKVDPRHPALRLLESFYLGRADRAEEHLTTEGLYTVAYPLAVAARVSGREDLARLALLHLQNRQERLVSPNAVYQRGTAEGERSFRNWGRGVTWYLLGLVRALHELEQHPPFRQLPGLDDLKTELERAIGWAMGFQSGNGLWYAFIDEPGSGPDTSGSAGIAAAVGYAAKHGYGPKLYQDRLQKTLRSLTGYLTPDGFLTGTCQSNRAGEALQRNSYRVISQYASGLMGQLEAALS